MKVAPILSWRSFECQAAMWALVSFSLARSKRETQAPRTGTVYTSPVCRILKRQGPQRKYLSQARLARHVVPYSPMRAAVRGLVCGFVSQAPLARAGNSFIRRRFSSAVDPTSFSHARASEDL